jgi:hypothetical protein
MGGAIFSVDLKMNQSFEERSGWVLRAVEDGAALAVPPACDYEAACAVKAREIADAPEDQ